MAECFSVLGVKFKNTTMQAAVEEICQNIRAKKQTMIVTANPEIVMLCKKDPSYQKIVQAAELVYADGIGVVWAGRHLGTPVLERIAGFDLMQNLFARANEKGYKIFLFGAREGIADKAIKKLRDSYPGINFVGARHGFFKPEENEQIVQKINAAQPDILLVALGAPKQEKWLHEQRGKLNCQILLGLGGCFDVLAGETKRAPLFWQKLGLEWFFRLINEPRRILRMAVLPKFVLQVLLAKKN